MSETTCATCAFYRPDYVDGHCMNPVNADLRNVGGGGEYSSSERVAIPQRVCVLQGCDQHVEGRWVGPTRIRPMPEEERLRRWQEEQAKWKGLTTRTTYSPYRF